MQIRLIALGLAATLAAGAQEPVSAGNSDRGMFIYESYCTSCHGDTGRGNGPLAARIVRDFTVPPADLASATFQAQRTDANLVQAIREGGASVHKSIYMPAWGLTLNQQQLEDVVAYVRELREPVPKASPVPRSGLESQLELGKSVYTQSCSACHGPTGEGGGPLLQAYRSQGNRVEDPPDLSSFDYFWTVTDRTLAAYASSGFIHSGFLRLTARNRWWHESLTPEESNALILYLRSLPFRDKSRRAARA